ncbi:DinB family protein [Paenibacillus tarimensis]
MKTRPGADEYLPMAERYIELVPDGSLPDIMQNLHDQTMSLLQGLKEEHGSYRYAEGKWSLKSVVGHISDIERLWSYRILRIARGDAREMPGYDRDIFAHYAPFDNMAMDRVLNDYSAVRQSTITLIGSLSEEALLRRGEFSGHSLSARAAAFIIAGHEIHHMNVIRERYLSV